MKIEKTDIDIFSQGISNFTYNKIKNENRIYQRFWNGVKCVILVDKGTNSLYIEDKQIGKFVEENKNLGHLLEEIAEWRLPDRTVIEGVVIMRDATGTERISDDGKPLIKMVIDQQYKRAKDAQEFYGPAELMLNDIYYFGGRKLYPLSFEKRFKILTDVYELNGEGDFINLNSYFFSRNIKDVIKIAFNRGWKGVIVLDREGIIDSNQGLSEYKQYIPTEQAMGIDICGIEFNKNKIIKEFYCSTINDEGKNHFIGMAKPLLEEKLIFDFPKRALIIGENYFNICHGIAYFLNWDENLTLLKTLNNI